MAAAPRGNVCLLLMLTLLPQALGAATTHEPYDCSKGFAYWDQSGATPAPTIPQAPYTMPVNQPGAPSPSVNYYDLESATTSTPKSSGPAATTAALHLWSVAKREWCCRHKQLGCPAASTTCPWDCQAGLSNWQAGWSDLKKDWCCRHRSLGCASTSAQVRFLQLPTTTSLLFDCNADYTGCYECAVRHWSQAKLTWCCAHGGHGCPTTAITTTSALFDCDADYTGCYECMLKHWSQSKLAWCCAHRGRGCATTSVTATTSTVSSTITTTSLPYDCGAGYDNWVMGWSSGKKAWCCQHVSRGCTTTLTTTSLPFDCSADYTGCYDCLRKHWSTAKLVWCCAHESRGCTTTKTSTVTTTTSLPYDCSAGYVTWQKGWSPAKKVWCCHDQGRGCTTTATSTVTTTTTLPFDCYAGFNNWEKGWSPAKKVWCCKHDNRGCTTTVTSTITTTTTLPFDCHAGFNNWEAGWSPAKKVWCCKHESRGCTTTVTSTITTTTSLPFDCNADYTDCYECVVRHWSRAKLSWCCAHGGRGCPTTTTVTTTTLPFDCDADYTGCNECIFKHWSRAKLSWCCTHRGRGCPTTSLTSTATVTRTSTSTSTWTWTSTQTASVTTTTIPKPMHCDLNCFGPGAKPVVLPGALGEGQGAQIRNLTLEECREACWRHEPCEGILYTGKSKHLPSMCFGKRDIHTSRCQPGGSYVTEVLRSRPWGKCAIFGDPHIISFDRVYGPPITDTDPGEFYLIKNSQLMIHARFGNTKRFPTASSAVGVALGGPLIKNHTLVVEYVGPEPGYKGFKVFWDGKEILKDYPSSFRSDDKVMTATHDKMNPAHYHREGRHTIGGTHGRLPSYYFQLQPDVNLYVLIGPDNCNAVIEMPKLPGTQDGFCGNFDCNQDDDSLTEIRNRGMLNTIPPSESLFRFGLPAAKWVMQKAGPAPTVENCDPALKAKAEITCKGLPRSERQSCVFDACASKTVAVAKEDVGVARVQVGQYSCEVATLGSWTDSKRKWCCDHRGLGCPSTAKGNLSAAEVKGCRAKCTVDGKSAACGARVEWAAYNEFRGKHNPCDLARHRVLGQCAHCSECTVAASGCADKTPSEMKDDLGVFLKKFGLGWSAGGSSAPGRRAGSAAVPATCLGAGCLIAAVFFIVARVRTRASADVADAEALPREESRLLSPESAAFIE